MHFTFEDLDAALEQYIEDMDSPSPTLSKIQKEIAEDFVNYVKEYLDDKVTLEQQEDTDV